MLTERLRDPEANVIEVDLSGIPNHNHIDVLTNIHEIYNAEKIDEKLYIKVGVNFLHYILCVSVNLALSCVKTGIYSLYIVFAFTD